MTFDPDLQLYTYPCPCGDRFQIGLDDLRDSEDIAVCPSCSLMIRVIFDLVRYSSLGRGVAASAKKKNSE
jgi:diphthamide biosynthesis protein 3